MFWFLALRVSVPLGALLLTRQLTPGWQLLSFIAVAILHALEGLGAQLIHDEVAEKQRKLTQHWRSRFEDLANLGSEDTRLRHEAETYATNAHLLLQDTVKQLRGLSNTAPLVITLDRRIGHLTKRVPGRCTYHPWRAVGKLKDGTRHEWLCDGCLVEDPYE